jgi:Phage tail sheath protein.
MTRPGVEVITSDQPVPRSAPTNTGVWFAVGKTAIGPVTATLVRSLSQYVNTYGDRTGGQDLYDAVDAYFREGGSQVYIAAIPTTPDTLSVRSSKTKSGDEPSASSSRRRSRRDAHSGT